MIVQLIRIHPGRTNGLSTQLMVLVRPSYAVAGIMGSKPANKYTPCHSLPDDKLLKTKKIGLSSVA